MVIFDTPLYQPAAFEVAQDMILAVVICRRKTFESHKRSTNPIGRYIESPKEQFSFR